ncbi:hypothetical protein K438DRAFT_1929692 [Mycena galopus ATCC 62051]|nr:hypothetical protein K438DRAFT_1929692 [Mycena galopus ATCC 62051]
MRRRISVCFFFVFRLFFLLGSARLGSSCYDAEVAIVFRRGVRDLWLCMQACRWGGGGEGVLAPVAVVCAGFLPDGACAQEDEPYVCGRSASGVREPRVCEWGWGGDAGTRYESRSRGRGVVLQREDKSAAEVQFGGVFFLRKGERDREEVSFLEARLVECGSGRDEAGLVTSSQRAVPLPPMRRLSQKYERVEDRAV